MIPEWAATLGPREERGLTQLELAELLGLGHRQLLPLQAILLLHRERRFEVGNL